MDDLAKKELSIAEHIMSITTGLVDNKHLVFSILEHVDTAIIHHLRAILKSEKAYVPSDRYLLTDTYLREYAKNREVIGAIRGVQKIMDAKRTGQRILERDDKLIIVTNSFEIITLDREQTKNYIRTARQFITGVLK